MLPYGSYKKVVECKLIIAQPKSTLTSKIYILFSNNRQLTDLWKLWEGPRVPTANCATYEAKIDELDLIHIIFSNNRQHTDLWKLWKYLRVLTNNYAG